MSRNSNTNQVSGTPRHLGVEFAGVDLQELPTQSVGQVEEVQEEAGASSQQAGTDVDSGIAEPRELPNHVGGQVVRHEEVQEEASASHLEAEINLNSRHPELPQTPPPYPGDTRRFPHSTNSIPRVPSLESLALQRLSQYSLPEYQEIELGPPPYNQGVRSSEFLAVAYNSVVAVSPVPEAVRRVAAELVRGYDVERGNGASASQNGSFWRRHRPVILLAFFILLAAGILLILLLVPRRGRRVECTVE